MKAVSISQPWASLVVLGLKGLETRSWQTHHRGPLAIHASKNFPRAARMLCLQDPCRSALTGAGVDVWAKLPRGVILGVVDLVDCVRVEETGLVPEPERMLGDFSPGQWIWRLANARLLCQPVSWRGQLGLFEVPDEVGERIQGVNTPRSPCVTELNPIAECAQATLCRTSSIPGFTPTPSELR